MCNFTGSRPYPLRQVQVETDHTGLGQTQTAEGRHQFLCLDNPTQKKLSDM